MSRPPHTALAKARTVHSKDRVRVKPSAPTEDLHTTYITPAPSTSATRDADLRKSTFHEATFARESWWTVSTLSTCGQHLGPISEINISTCGQHLGGRSPTSNINISVDPKPHPAGALAHSMCRNVRPTIWNLMSKPCWSDLGVEWYDGDLTVRVHVRSILSLQYVTHTVILTSSFRTFR